MYTVAVFVGSLRRESINMRLAKAVAKLATSRLEFRFAAPADLPMYSDDLWMNPPQGVLRLKADIAAADGVEKGRCITWNLYSSFLIEIMLFMKRRRNFFVEYF